VIDNEACKNATVIRVRVLVSFFGGCVLFSLAYYSCCFLGTKYFIVLQVDSANKHGILLEVDSANKHGILLEVDSANKICLGMTAFAIDFLAHGFMDSFVGILYQAY
jgi:hypothetical protein